MTATATERLDAALRRLRLPLVGLALRRRLGALFRRDDKA
jgi:hypothetical protein